MREPYAPGYERDPLAGLWEAALAQPEVAGARARVAAGGFPPEELQSLSSDVQTRMRDAFGRDWLFWFGEMDAAVTAWKAGSGPEPTTERIATQARERYEEWLSLQGDLED